MHPDIKFIIYLKENNPKGIQEIYALYSEKVKRMILKNSGTLQDAADIFQDTLIDLYKLAHKPNFELTCPFEAFLIILCKRKWLNELKKRGRRPVTNFEDLSSTIKDEQQAEAEQLARQVEREKTIMKFLDKMGERCRSIIKACMGTQSQSKVAEKLGLSYGYLRKKKSHCMGQLRKMVEEHPLFQNNAS